LPGSSPSKEDFIVHPFIRNGAGAALAAMLFAAPLPVLAQASGGDLEKEIDALKKGQQEILKQLDEIKKLVQARPAAPQQPSGPQVKDIVFNLGNNPIRGAATAKLTLVEFTDYQ
jgi:protein-disulfide isomerase